jgi:hypothetical protein
MEARGDDGGHRWNQMIKISLSCVNGFGSEGLMDSEQLDFHRDHVEGCILRDLIKPIVEHYWSLKKENKSLEPSRDFLSQIYDIVREKMGLMIYK